MAQYKVPQDVEAEDKLIGPFSFRQFIYLGVVALCAAVMFGLWQLFPGLIIVPLPFAVLFLVLALPLRKDQPMETYLTAVIRFYLKPRRRLWQPEGSMGLVTIVAPKVAEVQLTKSVGGVAAAQQLQYLAQVVDTQGWASRGVVAPTVSMNDTAYAEAQTAEDILDDDTRVARTFDSMIDKSNSNYRQTIVQKLRDAASTPSTATTDPGVNESITPSTQTSPLQDAPTTPQMPTPPSPASVTAPAHDDDTLAADLTYNPYPKSMHQHVVNPVGVHSHQSPVVSNQLDAVAASDNRSPDTDHSAQDTSLERPSPDIMRLANNNDLSISALANEAHRLESRDNEEVVINLH